jgi:hypothetical protein
MDEGTRRRAVVVAKRIGSRSVTVVPAVAGAVRPAEALVGSATPSGA